MVLNGNMHNKATSSYPRLEPSHREWSIPTRCTPLVQAETDKRLAERERHLESCQEQLNMEKVSCG